ncbi:MAG: hypothetical protein ACKOQ0_01670 [Solirubrobacterales bacterium]
MRKIKILMVGALVASVAGVMASSAVANPAEYQRFTWAAKGKAGTDKKPSPVELTLNPYHEAVGTPPAFLENPPFATVFAHIWFPKEIVFNLSKIPGCAETTILNDPDACPKGSEVSKKGAGVAAGVRPSDQRPGRRRYAGHPGEPGLHHRRDQEHPGRPREDAAHDRDHAVGAPFGQQL